MTNNNVYGDYSMVQPKNYQPEGRFPANLILTHHPECTCNGTKKVKPSNGSGKASEKGGGFSKGMFGDGTSDNIGGGFTDENGEETVEDWTCHEDCPIRIMDEQSGELKSGDIKPYKQKNTNSYSGGMPEIRETNYKGDKGGASRFFYCAKASKSERNKGLNEFEETHYAAGNQAKAELKRGNTDFNANDGKGRDERNNYNQVGANKNFHPTVKPVKLMQYLVRLITPPNGIVLDPFMGSGTTGIACKLERFEFVGMELDPEYAKIAEARITNYTEEIEVTKKVEKNNDSQHKLF